MYIMNLNKIDRYYQKQLQIRFLNSLKLKTDLEESNREFQDLVARYLKD